MAVKYLVGIDFGHGETTASFYNICGTEEPIGINRLNIRTGDDEKKKIPSVIYRKLENDGSYDYNIDGGTGYAPYISFKDKPNELNKEQREAFQKFIGLVYNRIIENNDFLTKDEDTEFLLYIASPTAWDKNEKANYKKFVEEAIKRPVEWVINESDAAYFKKKEEGEEDLVLVIDFGSSTIDYTLMHNKQKINIDYLSNRLGAELIESYLLDVYKDNPKSNYNTCKNISEKLKKDNGDFHVDIDTALKILIRKNKEYAYSDGAKDLSFRTGYIDKDLLHTMTGNIYIIDFDDFENEYLKEYIKSVQENFEGLKKEIYKRYPELKTTPKQLHIILSGGAARMPWVKKILKETFNTDVEKDSFPEYIVSDGIVKYAYALWSVKTELSKIADKFHDWFSTAESDLKDMIQKVCREICLETTKNDPRIIDYCSASFENKDGEIKDNTQENLYRTYYKSSIKGFMSIIDEVNRDIYLNRKSINNKIYQSLNQKLHDSLYEELHQALLDTLQKDISEITFLQNQHFLPTINNDFTIGSENIKEISAYCVEYLKKHGRSFIDTGYGNPTWRLQGSYRKKREQVDRELIAESYYKYIESKSFAPYSDEELKQIKDGIYSQVIDAIINITTEHLAFNPCGYDLKKELFSKDEVAPQKVNTENTIPHNSTTTDTQVEKIFSIKVTGIQMMGTDTIVEGEIKLGEVAEGDTLFIGYDHPQMVNVKKILDNEAQVGGLVRMLLDCNHTLIKIGATIHSKTFKD